MYIHSNGWRFVTLPKYEYKFVGVSVTSCGECDATFKIRTRLSNAHDVATHDRHLFKCLDVIQCQS